MIMALTTITRDAVHHGMGSRLSPRRLITARRQRRYDEEHASVLIRRFRGACYLIGLAEDTTSCAGIPGIAGPDVLSMKISPAPRFIVRMRPGQLFADYVEAADRLAEALGVDRVRVTHRGHGLVRIQLVEHDPMAQLVELPQGVSSVHDPILLGRVETGENLSIALAQTAHLIIQGQTRSGKSRWTYGLLAQLAGASDALIVGSDVTGLLLRAFAGTRHEATGWHALGSGNPDRHAQVLEQLVAEMDSRITRIPARRDTLPITEQDPALIVVLEEMPGLLKAAEAADAKSATKGKVKARIQGAVSRLLAEGAKVGIRVVLIAQRADASIVGGFERGQAPIRLSFRVDTASSVEMLHPQCPAALGIAHGTEMAGVALVSGPELPLARLRAPQMGDYGNFLDLVHAACRCAMT